MPLDLVFNAHAVRHNADQRRALGFDAKRRKMRFVVVGVDQHAHRGDDVRLADIGQPRLRHGFSEDFVGVQAPRIAG